MSLTRAWGLQVPGSRAFILAQDCRAAHPASAPLRAGPRPGDCPIQALDQTTRVPQIIQPPRSVQDWSVGLDGQETRAEAAVLGRVGGSMARRNGSQALEDKSWDRGLNRGPRLGKARSQASGHSRMARRSQIPASGGWADTAAGNRSSFRMRE